MCHVRIEYCLSIQHSSNHFKSLAQAEKFSNIQKRQNMLLRIVKDTSMKNDLFSVFENNRVEGSVHSSTKCSGEKRDLKSAEVAIPTVSYSGQEGKTPGFGNNASPIQPTLHNKVCVSEQEGMDTQSKKNSGEQPFTSPAIVFPTVYSVGLKENSPFFPLLTTSTQPTVQQNDFRASKHEGVNKQSIIDEDVQYSTVPQITLPTVSSLCLDGISPMICIYTTATQPIEHQNDFRDFKPEGIDRQFINDSGGQHSRLPTMYTPTVFSLG